MPKRAVSTFSHAHGRALPWVLLLIAIGGTVAWWYFAPQTLPDTITELVPVSPKAAPTLYKWRDAEGQLHVTDVPPKDRPYESVKYDPNSNVVPSMASPSKHE